MAPKKRFKYEVALCFGAADEVLATELNDLLQDRFRTFLYSKSQEELADRDAAKILAQVFGKTSRLVVVLYRPTWGESPWTRIEEIAVRNRAQKEDYDFVTVVPLEGNKSPKWIPQKQLWSGLDRWGMKGAAAVIEARVQSLGGQPSEESIEDRAKRLERSLQFERERDSFKDSFEGVRASDKEFELMADEIQRLLHTISKRESKLMYSTKQEHRLLVVSGPNKHLRVEWRCAYNNSFDDGKLEVTLWDSQPPFPGVTPDDKPVKQGVFRLDFDLLRSGICGWRMKQPEVREFDSLSLAYYAVKYLLDRSKPDQP